MKDGGKTRLIILFCFAVVIGIMVGNYNQNVLKADQDSVEKMMLEAVNSGDNVDKGKIAFENKIEELLFVSIGDIYESSQGGGVGKIDMESRRQYFTDQGWSDYQEYVVKHKEIIRVSNKLPVAKASFMRNSEMYVEKGQGRSTFHADGVFSYGKGDMYIAGNEFKIMVSYSADETTTLSDFLIHSWNIEIFNEEGRL